MARLFWMEIELSEIFQRVLIQFLCSEVIAGLIEGDPFAAEGEGVFMDSVQ